MWVACDRVVLLVRGTRNSKGCSLLLVDQVRLQMPSFDNGGCFSYTNQLFHRLEVSKFIAEECI